MKEKKENQKIEKKKKIFFNTLVSKLLDLGTDVLKDGFTNFAVSQIDNTEEEIKKVLDQKFQSYKKKMLKFISFGIALSFISYGLLSLIMSFLNLEKFTNLIFGIIFLIIALVVNERK